MLVSAGFLIDGLHCDSSAASTNTSCERIADVYTKQTGQTPPWLAPSPYPVQSASMKYERDTIDLETGTLCLDLSTLPPCNQYYEFGPQAPNDFHFAFNAVRAQPTVLFQRQGCEPGEVLVLAEIAFLDRIAFSAVDAAWLATWQPTFTSNLIDEPLDYPDTVVLRTCEGNYFKIGEASCNAGAAPGTYPPCEDASLGAGTVKFSYQRIQ